jgi:hypothetical protein
MKRVTITKNNIITNMVELPDSEAQAWLDNHITRGTFGPVGSYQVSIVDITSEVNQREINREAEQYLASTDWLIIREQETGVACPQNIKTERAAARARIVR